MQIAMLAKVPSCSEGIRIEDRAEKKQKEEGITSFGYFVYLLYLL